MAAFTVQFELGPETRALVERLVGRAAIEIELGPRARELMEHLVPTQRDTGSGRAPDVEDVPEARRPLA